MARSYKFRIYEEEGLYYPCRENQGADQAHFHCIYHKHVFVMAHENVVLTGQASELSSIFPDVNQQFTKEVEDEANSYFQRIFKQPPYPTMTIDEVLEMLKRFKDSQNSKEKV